MFRKTSCLVAITLALGAPALAIAGGNEPKLNCPAGTAQRHAEGKNAWLCAKTDPKVAERSAHGPYLRLHPNGQKATEGQHLNGSRVGLWTQYDENGAKVEQIEFADNDYNGRRVQYFPSGQVKLEERWVSGKREGASTSYSEDGQKVSEAEYRAGHMVKEQRFENGKPVANK